MPRSVDPVARQTVVDGALSPIYDYVVPRTSRTSAAFLDVTHIFDSFDPGSILLDEAAGGFDTVFEASPTVCLSTFDKDLQLVDQVVRISASDFGAFCAEQKKGFASAHMNALAQRVAPTGFYTLTASFAPASLRFEGNDQVVVSYVAYVLLEEPPRPAPSIKAQALAGPVARIAPAVQSADAQGFVLHKAVTSAEAARIREYMIPSLGELTLDIHCKFAAETDAGLARIDVRADLAAATIEARISDPDLKLVYDKFLSVPAQRLPRAWTPGGSGKIKLIPTISLVGPNPSSIAVTDFARMNVQTFRVTDLRLWNPRAALAIAVDLGAASNGRAEDVSHFIGDEDYGIISSEYLVRGLFHCRWRMGEFARSFTLEAPVVATVKGSQQDVTLKGTMTFDTLDDVSIQMNADTRTDGIMLGGSATSVAQALVLADGTTYGPDQADLGPPRVVPWNLFTSVQIDPELATDGNVRAFQVGAQKGAYRFIAKPFAYLPDPDPIQVVGCRTEGISRHVYCLGKVADIFL